MYAIKFKELLCGRSYRCLVAMLAFWLLPALSLVYAAEEADLESPTFNFEAVEEGLRSDSQVFTVFVTDDGQIKDVTIFYRFVSDGPYQSQRMSQLAGTDIFTHTITSSEISADSNRIEYYIRATDVAGNLSLEGFSFDPIVRTLVDGNVLSFNETPAVQSVEVDSPEVGLSTSRKWLYGALGVVLVGALLSASSSSGGDSGAQADPAGVNVTVLVDPLPGAQ